MGVTSGGVYVPCINYTHTRWELPLVEFIHVPCINYTHTRWELPLVEFIHVPCINYIPGGSYLWWSLCTLYKLHTYQVGVTSGGVYIPCINYTHAR